MAPVTVHQRSIAPMPHLLTRHHLGQRSTIRKATTEEITEAVPSAVALSLAVAVIAARTFMVGNGTLGAKGHRHEAIRCPRRETAGVIVVEAATELKMTRTQRRPERTIVYLSETTICKRKTWAMTIRTKMAQWLLHPDRLPQAPRPRAALRRNSASPSRLHQNRLPPHRSQRSPKSSTPRLNGKNHLKSHGGSCRERN